MNGSRPEMFRRGGLARAVRPGGSPRRSRRGMCRQELVGAWPQSGRGLAEQQAARRGAPGATGRATRSARTTRGSAAGARSRPPSPMAGRRYRQKLPAPTPRGVSGAGAGQVGASASIWRRTRARCARSARRQGVRPRAEVVTRSLGGGTGPDLATTLGTEAVKNGVRRRTATRANGIIPWRASDTRTAARSPVALCLMTFRTFLSPPSTADVLL